MSHPIYVPSKIVQLERNDQLSADAARQRHATVSNVLGYAYDFESHLIQQGGISIVYDGDHNYDGGGNRVSKTVAGPATTYLVDPFSSSGCAEAMYETFSGIDTGNPN